MSRQPTRLIPTRATWCCVALTALAGALPTHSAAHTAPPSERRLRAMSQKIARLEQQLTSLQAQLRQLRSQDGRAAPGGPERPASPASTPAVPSALSLSGDARLRYEYTGDGDRHRNRGVLRARLAAEYRLDDRIDIGARLTTGDAGDPNSSDITLGNFVDDLEVSLDRAYARYRGSRGTALGGKFANPFTTRELVWDGDVNPQGVAASMALLRSQRARLQATALLSPIDEQIDADDSTLRGAQLELTLQPHHDWTLALASAYYDYEIGSLAAADRGDIRDNRLTADSSAYLSDFNLWDSVASAEYRGLGEHLPVRISLDYVTNLGAFDSQDSGYQLDFSLGDSQHAGDWRAGYTYARNDIDAVLAAFSQDNITYSSNYRMHGLTLEYLPVEDVVLNLTAFHYTRNRFQPGYGDDWGSWITRLRMNVSFRF
ncbi:putative porin [Parahaliea mediterranea]|uniref:Porin n=1 Tax=Parahaliea mediterranea TaxID=651086 RepID=A0A939DC04_9GAMM|nr:putative porin [Parahaliea mediterranea]MBN7795448.1 putative porin [Parahaliea mediterranea]